MKTNKIKDKLLNTAIPGENYTSDTKNYPWHRPPKYSDVDEVMDFVSKHLLEKRNSKRVLTSLELGIPVSALVDGFVMSGVGSGKWTVDFGIILAGPIADLMVMMAEAYDIDYKLGIDDEDDLPSPNYFKNISSKPEIKIKPKAQEEIREKEEVKRQEKKSDTGFMTLAPEDNGGPV